MTEARPASDATSKAGPASEATNSARARAGLGLAVAGLGLLSYEALKVPDIPVLQGVFLLFSAGVILANLVADLCYPLLDPRIA